MEELRYTLYLHRCKENGKVYIGITEKNADQRFKNGDGYKTNFELYTDIKKYGWEDGFEHHIIRDDLTESEAKINEVTLINIYKASDPNKGYNHDKGGKYGKRKHSDAAEIGEKIKSLRKTQHLKQDDIAKIFGVSRGSVSNWEKGRRIPDVTVLNELAKKFGVGLDYFGQEQDITSISDIIGRVYQVFSSSDVDDSSKKELFNQVVILYSKYVLQKDEDLVQ